MVGENARYDLVIAGLGPVGAVAANLAGLAGLKTLVIERGTEPYTKPRAIVFDAEIMRIFDSIGLAEKLADVTRPLGGSVYLGVDRAPIRIFRARPRAHGAAWHPSNVFYQPQLEGILRAGLARFDCVTLLADTMVSEVEAGPEGVTVDTDRGRFSADCLLACDGASSAVRKSLGIALDDIGFEERWLVVDTNMRGPMKWPADYMIPAEVRDGSFSLMVCELPRPSTLIPGRGQHRRWEYMLLEGEEDEEVLTDAWLHGRLAQWVDPGEVEIVRAAVYRFRALVAERWRLGRVFLLGDAAHQTPPFFGQGMCHGIRDAAQLMWKLLLVRSGAASPSILDSYQREREPHVREIISASVAAGKEICKLDLADALERDERFREIERGRVGTVAMTDVVPPIRDGIVDPSSGGERLPEFMAGGQAGACHVDRLLAGRFTLLALDAATIATHPVWTLVGGQSRQLAPEHDRQIAPWFAERSADWAIVRPDRYVFATGAGNAALERGLALLARQLGVPTRSENGDGEDDPMTDLDLSPDRRNA